MKRGLITSVLAVLMLAGCGKDDENANAGTNNSTATNSATNNANIGTNNASTIPMAGDCEWGEHIAACGVESLPMFGGRAIGCRDFYAPSENVTQADNCDEDIWDETQPCSEEGLSGRRPAGCCYELVDDLYTRSCVYNDPAQIESTAMDAQAACEDQGFCWVDLRVL